MTQIAIKVQPDNGRTEKGGDEDCEDRTVCLIGEVEEGMLRTSLQVLNLDRTPGIIQVILSSQGGSVEDGMAIYDILRGCKNEVHINAYGPVKSMAVLLMQAGDLRIASPECRFLLHNGSMGHEAADPRVVQSATQEVNILHERYCKLIASRSKRSLAQILKWCNDETYFSAQEAKSAGLIDEITPVRRHRRK